MATDTILGVTARHVEELPTAMGGAVARRIAAPDGLPLLCIGGTPGKAYEAPERTEGR
jgi:hypothetical protein